MKENKKDKYIQIRCTEEQREMARKQAESVGLNVSQYFWYLVHKDKRTMEFEHNRAVEEAKYYD